MAALSLSRPHFIASEIQATQVDLLRHLKSDYDASLLKAGLMLDPNAIPTADKVDNVISWPKINLGNIFEYSHSVQDYNKEYIGKYKDQKAYSYWEDGNVGEILCYRGEGVPDETVLVFSSVVASMGEDSRNVWILTEMNGGKIVTAWCACMAGTIQ